MLQLHCTSGQLGLSPQQGSAALRPVPLSPSHYQGPHTRGPAQLPLLVRKERIPLKHHPRAAAPSASAYSRCLGTEEQQPAGAWGQPQPQVREGRSSPAPPGPCPCAAALSLGPPEHEQGEGQQFHPLRKGPSAELGQSSQLYSPRAMTFSAGRLQPPSSSAPRTGGCQVRPATVPLPV